MNIQNLAGLALSTLLVAPVALAQDMPQSGFMEDYSLLSPVGDGSADYRYLAEGAFDKVAKYQAIMLDQPEIFIADDSPYKGAKPKHLDSLADAFRAGISQGLSENYYVVDQPGDNVMYAGVAISNLYLEKKKRRLIGYTPVGLVGGAVVGAAQSDIASKANLQKAVMEFEVRDSQTGELIVAVIDMRGAEEHDATWEELEAAALAYGRLASCRLSNASFPPDARVDCLAEMQKQRSE